MAPSDGGLSLGGVFKVILQNNLSDFNFLSLSILIIVLTLHAAR